MVATKIDVSTLVGQLTLASYSLSKMSLACLLSINVKVFGRLSLKILTSSSLLTLVDSKGKKAPIVD